VLDLSSKEDASDWHILILSHHPLDWWSDSYVFAYVLDAYKNGTSWSNGTISVDYTGKNEAVLIGNIHGHIHNFKTDYLHLGNVNSGNKSTVLRMSTPNACYGRENQYDTSSVGLSTWEEDVTYSKTKDSADDTAFVVYCIDLDSYEINAICYGAGYDRSVKYGEVKIVNLIDTVGYSNDVRLSSSSGTEKTGATGNVTTGFIELGVQGDVYRTSGVDFSSAASGYNIVCFYNSSKSYTNHSVYLGAKNSSQSAQGIDVRVDASGNLTMTLGSTFTRTGDFIKITGFGDGANLVVTKNQLIG
jgi:hypothetical protein